MRLTTIPPGTNLNPRALMQIRRLASGVLLCVLAACGGEPENPFAEIIPVRAPDRDATLVFTSDSWSTRSGVPRELFAVRTDGSGLSRLTYCNNDQRRCDSAEISPAPDRLRAMVRRVT